MDHYFHLQIGDFLRAIMDDREPLVTGEDGRKTVEIFTAIYRSQKTNAPVKFPLKPEAADLDYSTYASVPLQNNSSFKDINRESARSEGIQHVFF